MIHPSEQDALRAEDNQNYRDHTGPYAPSEPVHSDSPGPYDCAACEHVDDVCTYHQGAEAGMEWFARIVRAIVVDPTLTEPVYKILAGRDDLRREWRRSNAASNRTRLAGGFALFAITLEPELAAPIEAALAAAETAGEESR